MDFSCLPPPVLRRRACARRASRATTGPRSLHRSSRPQTRRRTSPSSLRPQPRAGSLHSIRHRAMTDGNVHATRSSRRCAMYPHTVMEGASEPSRSVRYLIRYPELQSACARRASRFVNRVASSTHTLHMGRPSARTTFPSSSCFRPWVQLLDRQGRRTRHRTSMCGNGSETSGHGIGTAFQTRTLHPMLPTCRAGQLTACVATRRKASTFRW